MTDEEWLQDIIANLEESVRFFSPEAKTERELWIARKFLATIGIPHTDAEISPSLEEPPDVCFRDSRFEIKVMLPGNQQMAGSYKEALAKARSAKDPRKLLESYSPKSISMTEAAQMVMIQSKVFASKYAPAVTRELDLLVYFNPKDTSVRDFDLPSQPATDVGWRSVSVLCNNCAAVLQTERDAPSFLAEAAGVVATGHV